MSKWLYSIILATTLGSCALEANDPFMEQFYTKSSSKPSSPPAFPYENVSWFTKESFLYWKPYVDDLDYGDRVTTTFQNNPQIAMDIRLKKPDFKWFPGVRVVLGRYLANDDWDLSAAGTYYYAETKDKTSPDPANGTFLTPLWPPITQSINTASKASNTWNLNFFTADLSLGREYKIFSTLVAHPYLGARGAFIYQKNKTSYFGVIPQSLSRTQQNDERFKSKTDFWGVGPRLGTDFAFKFGKHWALIGNFAAALLAGKYENRVRCREVFTTTGSVVFADSTIINNFKVKDDGFTIRSNLEGSLGLSWEWETSYRNRDVRISPSLVFEASEWFGVNQLPRFSGGFVGLGGNAPETYLRQHGDLGFLGLNFNLQLDF